MEKQAQVVNGMQATRSSGLPANQKWSVSGEADMPYVVAMPQVTFLCFSNDWGGLEMNTLRIAKCLQSRGLSLRFVALPHSETDKQAVKSLNCVLSFKPGNRLTLLPDAFALCNLLQTGEPQVLFVPHNRDLPLAVWISRFSGGLIRPVYRQHMQLGLPKRDFWHTWRYSCLAAWICPSEYLEKQVLEKTNINPAKIYRIPIGITPEFFQESGESSSAVRHRLNLPQKVFTAGILGRLDPQKGQLQALEALAMLRNGGIHINLLIMGNGNAGSNYPEVLKAAVARLGLSENVFFRPHSDVTAPFFKACDAIILPSVAETYGTVTLEALAAGLPVIATNTGGTPELLQHGKFGLLYEPSNTEALALHLKTLAETLSQNKEALSESAAEARTMVLQNYTIAQECKQTEELIKKLLA